MQKGELFSNRYGEVLSRPHLTEPSWGAEVASPPVIALEGIHPSL